MNPTNRDMRMLYNTLTETAESLDRANATTDFLTREANLRTQLSAARALRDANNGWHDLNEIIAVFSAFPLAAGGLVLGFIGGPVGSGAGAVAGFGAGVNNVRQAANCRHTYNRACNEVTRLERELETLRNAHRRGLAALSDT